MKKIFFFIFLFSFFSPLNAQISIQGNKFYNDCHPFFFNGVNTPWHNWDDMGGNFDRNFWENHFQQLKSDGINSSRVWISCDGEVAPTIDNTGLITGVSAAFWKNCDTLFAIAKRYGIYILATMMSFDHCKNYHPKYALWRSVITNVVNSQSYIDQYLVPFAQRYQSNKYLFAIDLCNEPEWINETTECGKLPVNKLQHFFAMSAAALHQNSTVLVTLGSASIKWNSDKPGCVGNYWKNSALQSAYNNSNASLDFYQIHYYEWMYSYFSSPFEKTPLDYGINDRPVLIGEMPGKDLLELPYSLTNAYDLSYSNGYGGCMAWTSNEVDTYGVYTKIAQATNAFKSNYPLLVFPPDCIADIVNEKNEIQFSIYPNPVQNKFVLYSELPFNSYVLYNSAGVLVRQESISLAKQLEVDVSSLSKGIYFLSVVGDEGKVSAQRKLLLY